MALPNIVALFALRGLVGTKDPGRSMAETAPV